MKIQGVNFSSINFRQKGHFRKNAREPFINPDWKNNIPATDLGYEFYNAIMSASKSENIKTELDLDEILALEVPEPEENKSVSFADSHGKFKMDKYQKKAVDAFKSGKTTIVCAPTGTGKTLIAEYAIKNALESGKKIIYTSPLKALSNEKYTDFTKLFGEYDEKGSLVNSDKVGLLTGDVSINPNADVLVMTTEVYKNSLISANEAAADEIYADYDGVIYDEFHYLGDSSRGSVWEEAVMFTPKHMKQLMLSATASNAKEIQNWIEDINPQIETVLINVPESNRHVPLVEYILVKDKNGALQLEETKNRRIPVENFYHPEMLSENQQNALLDVQNILQTQTPEDTVSYFDSSANVPFAIKSDIAASKLQNAGMEADRAKAISVILSDENFTKLKKTTDEPLAANVKISKIVNLLHKNNMDPALVYIFSKRQCNEEFDYAAQNGQVLLTPAESKRVYDEIKKAQNNGVYLGADFDTKDITGLMKGYAVHHAGKLPAYKSLVENLAREGLVKVCFATETLIAGINMPFKTTLFTQLDKYQSDEEGFADISVSTYKQGSGRAGRRGKDEIGNVVILAEDDEIYDTYRYLTGSKNTSIISQETPTYASCLSNRLLNKKYEFLSKGLAMHQNTNTTYSNELLIDSKMALLEKFGFVSKNSNNEYERTAKGEIAKNIYGTNEIVLTELIYEPEYLQGLKADELIAICSSLADVKDENPANTFKGEFEYLNPKMKKINDLKERVNSSQLKLNIMDEPAKVSTSLSNSIAEFSKCNPDRTSSISHWNKIMNDLKNKGLAIHEGDFLRVVNGTIDILKMVNELCIDEDLKQQSKQALLSLMKPPVIDILNYELGQ